MGYRPVMIKPLSSFMAGSGAFGMSHDNGQQAQGVNYQPTEQTGKDATRREFLQGSLAVVGTLLTSQGSHAQTPTEPAQKRPNLVFFFGEGHRADALSIAGHPILKTPNHDRIGREGIRFRNAFCTNALCAPARATALTGMYSRSTGALSNEHMNVPLPTDIPLFTDLLHEAGYEVAILGKVHIRNGVEERYWDYYFGHNDPGNNYANPLFKEGHKGKIGPEKQYFNVYPDDLTVDRALAWLEEDRGENLFVCSYGLLRPMSPSSARGAISISTARPSLRSPQRLMTI
jgi:hypothetical protein